MKKLVSVSSIIWGFLFALLFSSTNLLALSEKPAEKITLFKELKIKQPTIEVMPEARRGEQPRYEFALSSNSRFFAVLKSETPSDGNYRKNKITVLDTETGRVAAQSESFTAELNLGKLSFSPDNTLLLLDDVVITPSVTWRFTETDEVDLACNTYMSSSIEAVDASGQTYIVDTVDGYYQLCKPGQENALLQIHLDKPLQAWWGEHTKILHNNKLLVIYNLRPEGEPAHQGKVRLISNTQVTIDPKWLDPWNLDYESKAEHFFTRHDPESKHLMLIESFPDQVAVNLWDYSKKQWLDKQFFQGLQADTAYTAGSYLLLQHESELALLSHQDGKLQLLWRKRFPDVEIPEDERRVVFSHDRQMIVFESGREIIRVNTTTGEHKRYPRFVQSDEDKRLKLSPTFNYRVSHYFDPLNLTKCVEREQNSSVYSVDGKEKLQALKGSVFAMSPDGQVLATCQGETLRLYRAETAAQ